MTGRNLLGIEPVRPMRIWYWNGEDPQEELERRVLAICLHYGVDRRAVEKNLFLDSGRDTEIIVATQTKTGAVIATPVEAALTAALIDGKFDAFILDPAVSVHRVSENDNMMIDAVAKTFGRIAGRANVAIEAVHHTRKLGGAAATIEDSRGASAWVSAARDVRVLNRMTKEEGAKAGIEDVKGAALLPVRHRRQPCAVLSNGMVPPRLPRTWQRQWRPRRRSGLCGRRYPLEMARRF